MDIQIKFDDGTTEMRDAESPSIADIFKPCLRHPSEERWYLYFPGESVPFSFCGHSIRKLSDWRGAVVVWRTTWDPETKVLSGAWASGRVESVNEQIDRLTRECDSTRRHLTEAVAQAIAHRDAEYQRAEVEKARADESERRLVEAEKVAEDTKQSALRGPSESYYEFSAKYRGMAAVLRILRGTQEDPSSLFGMGA